ncbi:Rz1 lytic protein [Enterobacterales bacterium CwR94]|nr:Rz1 lytic protein [Enterobacterales bacterium CwR94]
MQENEPTDNYLSQKPILPLPASLIAETPVPGIPNKMTYGQSVIFNMMLLGALRQCNNDKDVIQKIERMRQGLQK